MCRDNIWRDWKRAQLTLDNSCHPHLNPYKSNLDASKKNSHIFLYIFNTHDYYTYYPTAMKTSNHTLYNTHIEKLTKFRQFYNCFLRPFDFWVVFFCSDLYFSIHILACENPRIVIYKLMTLSNTLVAETSSHPALIIDQKNKTSSLLFIEQVAC